MMYDLNLNVKLSSGEKERFAITKRCIELGWDVIAWTVNHVGAVGSGKSSQLKPNPPLSIDGVKLRESLKIRSLVAASPVSGQLRQLSRLHVVIDEIVDAQCLTAGNEVLKRFDIVSVCPGNTRVFSYLCKTAQIDIISFDLTHHMSFPLNKKLIDEAVQRGIHFELQYSPTIDSQHKRREILSNSKVLIQYLGGNNLILTSGADSAAGLRGPLDLDAIGAALQLTLEKTREAISVNPCNILRHAVSRKRRHVPIEMNTVDEFTTRFPELSYLSRPSSRPFVRDMSSNIGNVDDVVLGDEAIDEGTSVSHGAGMMDDDSCVGIEANDDLQDPDNDNESDSATDTSSIIIEEDDVDTAIESCKNLEEVGLNDSSSNNPDLIIDNDDDDYDDDGNYLSFDTKKRKRDSSNVADANDDDDDDDDDDDTNVSMNNNNREGEEESGYLSFASISTKSTIPKAKIIKGGDVSIINHAIPANSLAAGQSTKTQQQQQRPSARGLISQEKPNSQLKAAPKKDSKPASQHALLSQQRSAHHPLSSTSNSNGNARPGSSPSVLASLKAALSPSAALASKPSKQQNNANRGPTAPTNSAKLGFSFSKHLGKK